MRSRLFDGVPPTHEWGYPERRSGLSSLGTSALGKGVADDICRITGVVSAFYFLRSARSCRHSRHFCRLSRHSCAHRVFFQDGGSPSHGLRPYVCFDIQFLEFWTCFAFRAWNFVLSSSAALRSNRHGCSRLVPCKTEISVWTGLNC